MSLELFDLEAFAEDGGLFIVLVVATALFGLQTFISYVLWKRGDDTYRLKFISLLIASIALFFGLIADLQVVFSGSEGLFEMGMVICMTAIPVAAAIHIYLFIVEKWLGKEEKA